MTGQQTDIEERAAGAIVAWELEGWWEPRDVPGAPEETHDLDVHIPGDRTVTLEVTSAGDRALDELRKRIFGEVWEAPSLRHHWWLGWSEQPPPQVKTLKRKIVPHLELLEQNQVAQVSTLEPLPADASPEVVAAARAIFELHAHRATRLDPPKPGETARLLSSLGSGRTGSADSLNGIVESCAAKKVKKLRAADGDEKHLLIWLRAEAHETVELATATLADPDAPPTLQEGIDVVWVAMGPPDPAAPTLGVLRVRPPTGWEQIRAPRSPDA
jgi:hypothetical protein